MQKVTPSTIAKATFTATEAGEFLPLAAQAAIKGKAEIDSAKAKGAAALAVMVAGFASDDIAAREWSFTVNGKEGVHDFVRCTGTDEYGNDDLAWKRNGEGAVSKVAQSAYKAALQATFFNLPESNPAVWTMASKAIPMARAIREEGMTAIIEAGELKLSGGTSDRAEAMKKAKSLSALAKVAKGEAGSNRDGGHGTGSGEGEEARLATPSEVLALAARLVEGAAKGEEALSNAALSWVGRIVRVVMENPEAFKPE